MQRASRNHVLQIFLWAIAVVTFVVAAPSATLAQDEAQPTKEPVGPDGADEADDDGDAGASESGDATPEDDASDGTEPDDDTVSEDDAGTDGDAGPSFNDLVMAGAEAYEDKKYPEALELFQQAYEIKQVPDLLFNMGIIADSLGETDLALKYLNEFVVAPDIDIGAREEALARIDQLEQVKRLKEGGDEDATDKTAATSKDETDAQDETDDEKKDELVDVAPPPPEPEEPSLAGPITLIAIGGAALIGGGVTAGLALSEHNAMEDATTLSARRDASDTGETLALVSDVLFGAGGGIAAAGFIWLAVELATTPSETGDVSVAPSIGRDGRAAVQLSFTF